MKNRFLNVLLSDLTANDIWRIDFLYSVTHDCSFERSLFMPSLTPQQLAEIPTLLPILIDWGERMEKRALSEGIAVNDILRNAATILRIKDIGAVRILAVPSICEPENQRIVALAAALGLSFSNLGGITFGHGILVHRSYAQDNALLTHELVHVRQYEQAGTIARYLPVYVQQLIQYGYQNMPLEREAVIETANMWPPPPHRPVEQR
jgi:hypothetical protein